MSVTFYARGDRDEDNFLNVANGNARDLLAFLGLTGTIEYGEIRGGELRKLVRAARTKEDKGRLGWVAAEPGKAMVIAQGRRPERMAEYLDALDKICDAAGELGLVLWN